MVPKSGFNTSVTDGRINDRAIGKFYIKRATKNKESKKINT